MAGETLYIETLPNKLGEIQLETLEWPNDEVEEGETVLGIAGDKLAKLYWLHQAMEKEQREICGRFHSMPLSDSAEYRAAELEHDAHKDKTKRLGMIIVGEVHEAFPESLYYGILGFRKNRQIIGIKTPEQLIKEGLKDFIKAFQAGPGNPDSHDL